MGKLYLKLAKKAIAAGITGLFLLFPVLASTKIPNDQEYSYQANVWNKIGASEAWEYSTGSEEVTVAIIDTGADTWHEDLYSNIWVNKKEIADNNLDDDGNGFVDDVNGWNFVENNNDVRTSVFDAKVDSEAVRHGTVIAGLIGAVGNNGRNGTGLNWSVKMMPIRAIASDGMGSYANLKKAVEYAVDNGADVITMSFTGDSTSEILKSALYSAYKKGVVVVAAAGNHDEDKSGNLDLKPVFPACFDEGAFENWLITVGATDLYDRASTFSNTGKCLDIMATGEGIFSTERYAPQYGYEIAFGGEWRGTSFAAPLVAGTAALIKAARPEWKASDIIPVILGTADSISELNPGSTGKIGSGRLNVAKAIKKAVEFAPILPDGSFYSVYKNTVKKLTLSRSEVDDFANLPGSTVISVAATDNDNNVVVLHRLGGFYFIRKFDRDGSFINEFSLDLKTAVSVKKIRLTSDLNIVTEQFDNRRKVTAFVIYDSNGKQISRFEIAGTVLAWDASRESGVVTIAQITRNVLNLKQINFLREEKYSFALKNIENITDLRVARFDSAPNEQVVFVAKQGKEAYQYVVSVDGQFFNRKFLGTYNLKDPWYVRPIYFQHDHVYHLLQYRKTGSFPIHDDLGQFSTTVIVPSDFGAIYY